MRFSVIGLYLTFIIALIIIFRFLCCTHGGFRHFFAKLIIFIIRGFLLMIIISIIRILTLFIADAGIAYYLPKMNSNS